MLFSSLTGGLFVLISIALLTMTNHDYHKLREERAALLERQNATRDMNRRYQGLESEVAGIQERLLQYRAFTTEVLIPAFMKHAEAIAKEEGLVISTITPGTREEVPPLTKIPFTIEMSGEFPRLHRFLYRLERSRPPLQIARLVMARGEGGQLLTSIKCNVFSAEEVLHDLVEDRIGEVAFQTLDRDTIENMIDAKGNIFSYSPHRERTTGAINEAKPIKPRGEMLGNPQLTAILYDGQESLALLNGVLLRIGDGFKGYRVVSIKRDRIVLADDKSSHELRIRDK